MSEKMDNRFESMAASPVSIQPKFVFGLRSDIKGNIHFSENQEVIYPVAGVIAIDDYKLQTQTFLRLSEKNTPTVIAISSNRKLLAIAEWNETNRICFINTYDLATLKKKKTLKFPKEVPTQEASYVEFTQDSRGLAVLSKEPDAFLTIFYFDKSETVIVGRVSNSNQKGLTADVLACNLSDTGLVSVGGNFTFKLMSRQDKSFGTIGTMNGEHKVITSLIWLTAEILVAGTSANQLLFIEGGDPKHNFEANSVQLIDLEKAKETDGDQSHLKLNQISQSTDKFEVHCLTYFENGFCYSQFNQLFVFEKEKSYVRYTRRTIIKIPIQLYVAESYKIQNVSINAQMDTVIVTAKHNQIYISKLFEPETITLQYLEFEMLGEPLHIGGIIGMSVCSWKPIIMTVARDRTVRIWNYETAKVELVKKYQVDINVIALHPTGLFVAVGFSDQLRLMEILLDNLKTMKSFDFPCCDEVVFSHQGHLLACAYGNLITIVSVFSFNVVRSFKGHSGKILSLAWSNDDVYLVSSENEGAIYQWLVTTGERTYESVEKGIEYRSLALTDDTTTYVCTHTGVFREVLKSDIVREINLSQPLTRLALARSDLMLFVGSEKGNLYNIQVPFLEAGGGTCTNYRFFSSAISTMKITFDDRFLVTGSDDGTLVVWVIVNSDGKTAVVDTEHGKCSDVIVPRQELIDKIDRIENLEQRLGQQSQEFSFQLEHAAKLHSLKIEKMSQGYEKTIADLKSDCSLLESKHIEENNIIRATIAQINDDHSKHILELEAKFNEKIITEFEKSSELKTKMDNLKEGYEKLLRKSSGCLQDTIETLEQNFNEQLTARQIQISQLLEEIKSKKSEFFQYCNQLNLDHDRNMVQLKVNYESQLKEANDNVLKWRTDAGVLRKQIDHISMRCTSLENEKVILLDEHDRDKKCILQLEQNVGELQRELQLRDKLVEDKEACLVQLARDKHILETRNSFLSKRIGDLEAEIEPRNAEIKMKNDRIAELEKEKINLERKMDNLKVQMTEANDKCRLFVAKLKTERGKLVRSETLINRICTDIFNMIENIQNISKLKEDARSLYKKYVDPKQIKHPEHETKKK